MKAETCHICVWSYSYIAVIKSYTVSEIQIKHVRLPRTPPLSELFDPMNSHNNGKRIANKAYRCRVESRRFESTKSFGDCVEFILCRFLALS